MSRGISDSESVSMTYLSHAGRVLVWWLSIVLEKSNISAQVYATVREAGVLKTAPQQSSCVSHFFGVHPISDPRLGTIHVLYTQQPMLQSGVQDEGVVKFRKFSHAQQRILR